MTGFIDQLSVVVARVVRFSRLDDERDRVFDLDDLVGLDSRDHDLLFLLEPLDCWLWLATSDLDGKLGFLALVNSDVLELASNLGRF